MLFDGQHTIVLASRTEIRTYRRVHRLLFFNNFPNEPNVGADCLVRSVDLAYSDQQGSNPLNPIYTFLVSVTQTGYARNGDWIRQQVPAAGGVHLQPTAVSS